MLVHTAIIWVGIAGPEWGWPPLAISCPSLRAACGILPALEGSPPSEQPPGFPCLAWYLETGDLAGGIRRPFAAGHWELALGSCALTY